MRRAALGLALAGLAPSAAHAGPWALGKGHVYAKVTYGHLSTRTLATPDGTLREIPRFTKHDASLYLAYGVDDRVTLLLSGFAYRRSSLRDFGTASGVGDVQLGLQVRLASSGPWVLAVRGTVQAPSGDETKGEGLLPTGSGTWEGEGVVSVGRSLAGGRGWAFVELGHQARGKDLRDGFTYGVQVGFKVGGPLLLAWNLRGVEPYQSMPGEGALASAAGLGDGVTYAAYGPTAIVRLGESWAVQLDVDGAFHARNLAKGAMFRAGLSYSR